MSTQISHAENNTKIVHVSQTHTPSQHIAMEFSNDKLELLKQTICKGATPDEFELFVHACKRTGLDPFMRQIHAVKRWDANLRRESMTIQTGIDGYRLIAERSGCYMPGPEPTFVFDEEKKLISATAYVKKLGQDGQWHVIGATAFYDEYVQTKKDKETGNTSPVAMWQKMPRSQLAKCAESLALRKAFPADLSGVYTQEEMQQAETIEVGNKNPQNTQQLNVQRISFSDVAVIDDLIAEDTEFRAHIMQILSKNGIHALKDIPQAWYKRIHDMCQENNAKKQMVETSVIENVNDKV